MRQSSVTWKGPRRAAVAGQGWLQDLGLQGGWNCSAWRTIGEEGARPFPDVHSERARGKLQQGNSAWILGIHLFAPGWSALAGAAQESCASCSLEIHEPSRMLPKQPALALKLALLLAQGRTRDLQNPLLPNIVLYFSHPFFALCFPWQYMNSHRAPGGLVTAWLVLTC